VLLNKISEGDIDLANGAIIVEKTGRRKWLSRFLRLAGGATLLSFIHPLAVFTGFRFPRQKKVIFSSDESETGFLYRDGVYLVNGNDSSYALRARCTHLGCRVAYDPTTGIFKCPCHGSRFDAKGERISGPARHSLERLEISRDKDGNAVIALDEI